MDWSRTKTVIIIALLLANLFIAYFVFFDDIDFYRDTKPLQNTMLEILDAEKISFETNRTISPMSIHKLQAHSIHMNLEKMVNDSQDLRVYDRNYIDDYLWAVSADNSLDADYVAISDSLKMKIDMIKEEAASKAGAFYNDVRVEARKKVLDVVEAFIAKNLKMKFEKELLYIKKYEDLYHVRYLQKFDDYLISGGSIDAIVYHGRVLSYSQRWYDIEEIDARLTTDDYVDVMYKLLREVKDFRKTYQFEDPIEIVEIRMGLGFYDDSHSLQVKYGELTPYYIFKTKEGHVIKVDALKVD